jgi:hypothetical protein
VENPQNQCKTGGKLYIACKYQDHQPTKWQSWLTLAEWWYNTTLHTSLKMTPFQALYGFKPPTLAESALRDTTK